MAEATCKERALVESSPSRNEPLNDVGLKPSDTYTEIGVIGTGAYGTVFMAKDSLNPNNVVALKKVRVSITENGIPLSTLREICLLKQLGNDQHPNVVRLIDVCNGPRENGKPLILYLVFEHCEQDLASFMEKMKPNGIPYNQIKSMCEEIIKGIDYLHSYRIIHRDLKPQNLLVTANGNIKLADFGLAKTYDAEMKLTSVVVTLWYRPPEVLLNQPYNSGVDIWSAGAVFYEMYSLSPLSPGTSEADQLDKIFRIIGLPPKNLWPNNLVLSDNFPNYLPTNLSKKCPRIEEKAKELIMKMLSFDPSNRPTAGECLSDPYFASD